MPKWRKYIVYCKALDYINLLYPQQTILHLYNDVVCCTIEWGFKCFC